jgi:Ca2+-binding RTX toxin-like protein
LIVDGSSAKASTIVGSAGKDSINGGTGADNITGGTGADTIDAGAGADTLVYLLQDTTNGTTSTTAAALGARNLFYSNAAVDTLSGGDGVDTILVGTTGTAVDITASDAWTGITDVEVIKAAANTSAVTIALDGTAATSGIYKVDLSVVTAATGSSIKVSEFAAANDTTLIGPSTATSAANITGGAGVDTITAAAGGGTIDGGAGADIIYGGAGIDVLLYATTAALFDDSYLLIDSIRGGGENDVLQIGTTSGSTGSAALTITADHKWARATTVETIKADTTGTVNITLNASAAAAGINKVDISASTEDTDSTIDVSAFGSLNGATLIGPSASTSAANITGGAGADTITAAGNGGTIIGGAGSDTITGAAGVDTIVINATVGVKSDSNSTTTDTFKTFTLASDFIKVVATGVHDFEHSADVSVATSTGKIDLNGDGTLTGDGDVNITFDAVTLVGTLSSDFAGTLKYDLTDTTGDDTITGGGLADTITYTGGADDLDGGAGTDTLVIKQSESGKLINTGTAYLYQDGPSTTMPFFNLSDVAKLSSGTVYNTGITLNGFEKIDASGQLNSTIGIGVWGTSTANSIVGGAGADFVRGYSGDAGTGTDTIVGNDGADFLRGSGGGDLIFGGSQTTTTANVYAEGSESTLTDAGVHKVLTNNLGLFGTFHSPVFKDANVLEGRHGNDTIVASTGKDVMFFQVTPDGSGDASGTEIGTDVIHNFTIGEDWVLVTNYIASGTGNGDHSFFGSTTSTAYTALGTAPNGQNPLLAGSNGWTLSAHSVANGTATLTYAGTTGVGTTISNAGFSITFVGLQGDTSSTTVNDFFYQ